MPYFYFEKSLIYAIIKEIYFWRKPMNNNQKLYGYILLHNEKFAFAIDGFIGRIFDGVSGFRFTEKIELPNVLYGITDKNYDIVINIASFQKTSNCIVFATDYYAIGSANAFHYDLSQYDRIDFVGGTGNSILDPKLIYPPCKWQDSRDIYENGCSIDFRPIKDVDKQYKLIVEETPLTFQSTIHPYQDRKDNKLGVTNSAIILRFDELQPFNTIHKWYSYIHKMTALLVQQQNVAFDKIKIYFGDGKNRGYANVYVNHGFENVVEKMPIRTISLRTFDRVFSAFSQMIDTEEFSINFLPENNNAVGWETYETVKNICTAVEFEFAKSNIKKEKESIIDNLIKKTKILLDEYKNATPELTDKAYQTISTSISNWNFPATEQFNYLYNASKTIIDGLTAHRHLTLSEDTIQHFVTCRNNIAHGGSRPSLNSEIADTAYCLKVLIYVSLLKRIGLTDDEISKALEFIF